MLVLVLACPEPLLVLVAPVLFPEPLLVLLPVFAWGCGLPLLVPLPVPVLVLA